MTELKQCPFCGEESNIYLGNSTDGYIRGTQYVEAYCNKCGARIKRHLVSEAIEAWNTRPNPWHTGTPTEAGLYVIAFRFGDKIEHEIREMFYSPDYGMTFGIKKDIVAWQKIEPYKETGK